MNPYERLRVRRAINAAGILTRIGGSRSPPEVFEAMAEASESFVTISELQQAAGRVIAEATGAEAGLPTAGGSASLLLAAAACIMKGTELENFEPKGPAVWRHIARRLPLHTEGLRTDFIVQRWNRDEYDHAVECAGGRLVEVGGPDGATEEELADAYSGRTAAYYYTVTVKGRGLPIETIVKVAHSKGAPVVVDACAEPPPKASLRRYIEAGVDLVAMSGGKTILGPNNTGILAGRRDLIKLAHLQSYPYEGVGRPAKMCRESIVGLVTALDLYLKQDEVQVFREQEEKAKRIAANLGKVPGVEAWLEYATSGEKKTPRFPLCCVRVDEEAYGMGTRALSEALADRNPSIVTVYEPYFLIENYHGLFSVSPMFLNDEEVDMIVEAITKIGKR